MSDLIFQKNLRQISDFKNVPEKWDALRVLDCFEIGRGRVISQIEIDSNPGIFPVYSSQTQNNGEMGHINSYDFEGEYLTWTTDGANAGTVFYRNGKFNCTNVCGTLKSKKGDDSKFFLYHLGRVSKKYVSYIGNPKLMNEVMANIAITRPPLPEQRKIARILSTVDAVIEKTEAAIAKYKAIKQGMMHDLFTRGLDASGKLRPNYEDAPELYIESKLGWVPKDWEVLLLSDVSGNILSNVDKKSYESEEPVLLCNYLDVYTNLYIRKSLGFMHATAKPAEITRFHLSEDDVLITKDSEEPDDIAVATVVFETISNLICGYHLAILRTDKHRLSGRYLMHQLHFSTINRQFTIRANGSTRYGLSKAAIDDSLLLVPKSIDEQIMVAERLACIDEKIDKEKIFLQKQLSLKQGLISDLLTGRVPVKVENQKEEEKNGKN